MVRKKKQEPDVEYQAGFYQVIVTDPENLIPHGFDLGLTARANPDTGVHRHWAWTLSGRAKIEQMHCVNLDSDCRGHKWFTEQPYRSGSLQPFADHPEEQEWINRHARSVLCPKCGKRGRPVMMDGVVKVPLRRDVPQIVWLDAEERARFDELVDPERERVVIKENRRGIDGKVTAVQTGYAEGPAEVQRELRLPGGRRIAERKAVGPLISLRFITSDKTVNPVDALMGIGSKAGMPSDDDVAQMARLGEQILAINLQIANARTDEERAKAIERSKEVGAKLEKVQSRINHRNQAAVAAAAQTEFAFSGNGDYRARDNEPEPAEA